MSSMYTVDHTPAEREYEALIAAQDSVRHAWTDLLRAMYHDTRDVPEQYAMTIRHLRIAAADIEAMIGERRETAR